MPYTPYYGYQPGYYPAPMPDQLAQLRQQYQQPAQMQTPPPQAQPQPAPSGINWVQGEEGAKAFLVTAGNSVMLMDSENYSFYIKTTDQSGMPLPLRVFDYKERIAAPKTPQMNVSTPTDEFITRSEFEALEAKINGFMERETTRPAKSAKQTTREKEDGGNG